MHNPADCKHMKILEQLVKGKYRSMYIFILEMFIYDVSFSKYVSINSIDISCHSYFQNNDSLSLMKQNNFSM